MGIKKLNRYIKEANLVQNCSGYGEIRRRLNIRDDEWMVIAVDANLYIHKYLHSHGDPVYGLVQQFYNFYKSKIFPVYIFDGIPPTSKENTVNSRKQKHDRLQERINDIAEDAKNLSQEEIGLLESLQRRNRKTSDDMFHSIKYIFDKLYIPYIQSPFEGDILCGMMYDRGLISLCLSDDIDIMIFGCRKIVRSINHNIELIDYNKILHKTNITHSQIIDICTICGTDYNKGLYKTTFGDILALIKKYENDTDINNTHNICNNTNDEHGNHGNRYEFSKLLNEIITSSDHLTESTREYMRKSLLRHRELLQKLFNIKKEFSVNIALSNYFTRCFEVIPDAVHNDLRKTIESLNYAKAYNAKCLLKRFPTKYCKAYCDLFHNLSWNIAKITI